MVTNTQCNAECLQLALFGLLFICVKKLVFDFYVWEWSLKMQPGSLATGNTTTEPFTFWIQTGTDLPKYSLLKVRFLM